LCMGKGYCKSCRKHGVDIHYIDRFPNSNILIRGGYSDGTERQNFECAGICEECEQHNRVTASELLQASHLWGEQAVHEMIAIDEYLNSLEPEDMYNAPELIARAPAALQFSEDRRASLEGLVMAAARVRISNGTPADMKQAARSVFIPFYKNWRQEDIIRKEFSEKWQFF